MAFGMNHVVEPRSAPDDFLGGELGRIQLHAPFPGVAGHIETAEGREAFFEIRHRVGVPDHEVGGVAMSGLIPHGFAPGIIPAVGAARGFFPFRFGRQPEAQPQGKNGGLVIVDAKDGLILVP